jgi:Domain of unknown function (DUF4150)
MSLPPNTRHPPHLEGSRDDSLGLYISKYPDVCKSPVCAVPYTIIAYESDDINTAPTVRYTGKRAHNMGSLVSQCFGDEPGVGLGVKSGTVGSVCHPKGHSKTVRVEKKWAVRHNDEVWMNDHNTTGKRNRSGSVESFTHTPPIAEYQVAQAAPQTMNDASPLRGGAPAPAQPSPQTPAPKGPAQVIPFPKKPDAPPPAPEQKKPPSVRWWTRNPIGLELLLIAEAFRRLGRMQELIDSHQPTDLQGRPIDSDSIKKDMMEKLGVKNEEELKALIERLKKAEEKTDAPPSVEPEPGVSVKRDEDDKEACGIRPHRVNKIACGAQGKESHHGLADFAFRTGTRDSPGHLSPNAPTLNNALTVCLLPSTHSALHRSINSPINNAGKVAGTDTVPFSTVREHSYQALDGVPENELSAKCRELYKRLLNGQFSGVAQSFPVRGRLTPTDTMLKNLSGPWGFPYP